MEQLLFHKEIWIYQIQFPVAISLHKNVFNSINTLCILLIYMSEPAMQTSCADGAGILLAHWQGLSLTSFTPSIAVAKVFLVFQVRELC